jgi:hypothetical protein
MYGKIFHQTTHYLENVGNPTLKFSFFNLLIFHIKNKPKPHSISHGSWWTNRQGLRKSSSSTALPQTATRRPQRRGLPGTPSLATQLQPAAQLISAAELVGFFPALVRSRDTQLVLT